MLSDGDTGIEPAGSCIVAFWTLTMYPGTRTSMGASANTPQSRTSCLSPYQFDTPGDGDINDPS
jgi:hypothetical protein